MRAVAELQVARSRVRHVGAWNIALWYAAAGETDRTLDWLERAFEVRDPPFLSARRDRVAQLLLGALDLVARFPGQHPPPE